MACSNPSRPSLNMGLLLLTRFKKNKLSPTATIPSKAICKKNPSIGNAERNADSISATTVMEMLVIITRTQLPFKMLLVFCCNLFIL